MLKSLSVTNFAIIDHIDLNFVSGMTVITGETGAGKSLIIDAISLLLGDRASAEMIRHQADKAVIIGTFIIEDDILKSVLNGLKIEAFDNQITIRREINGQNKNTIKINDTPITLQQLKELSHHLADIHSQFDSQRLINPANYLELIDGFKTGMMASYMEKYHHFLEKYRTDYAKYQRLLNEHHELIEKTDLYRYQYKELTDLNLVLGEIDDLHSEATIMENFDKIHERLHTIKKLLRESGTIDNLYEVYSHFSTLTEMTGEFRADMDKTRDFYYELDDLEKTITKRLDSMNYDPQDLNRISERLSTLENIVKKYHKSIPDLIEYQEQLTRWIDQTDNYEVHLQSAVTELTEVYNKTLEAANDISAIRSQITNRIEKELSPVFVDLALPQTQFKIIINSKTPRNIFDNLAFLDNGIDQVEFMISTNVGEPLKPLSKTVSGGEMSRIMLAFKTIFIRSQKLETMIFDEIDTGISGLVARQIARKIKAISTSCQVISISHIPQVVAIASTHLKVWKQDDQKRTTAFVKELTYEERIQDLSEMISGDRVTDVGRQSAKELLLGE
ncbi:MAG: DNA repair protein RecN [Candidatus Izemoplasmatales bacterium]|nr:DNA repair protein RecN [Candidatus Izemoplasmatales bacterium]MDD3864770.1 DNA repair protein RecN [Candidatus Izemoplasmatales bacterium]